MNNQKKLIPVHYTWEEHKSIVQEQFHVLKKLRSQDSYLVFLGFSHIHIQESLYMTLLLDSVPTIIHTHTHIHFMSILRSCFYNETIQQNVVS